MTLSDVPLYSMQREYILLGENYVSEARTAHKYEVLSKQFANEIKLSNSLLESMLPSKVVSDLRAGRPVYPEQFTNASIFFSDIVGFTSIASNLEPSAVVDLLNQLYVVMDRVCKSFGLYKVETIGDAYMVVGGVPEPSVDHAVILANFAVCVRAAVTSVMNPLTNRSVEIRIGLHSGKVMGGVVGNMMPRFCLFGDTVNTASRMESTGEPSKIHCSSAFADFIAPSNQFKLIERGDIEVKGKGIMKTFWLDDATESNAAANEASQLSFKMQSIDLVKLASIQRPEYNIQQL